MAVGASRKATSELGAPRKATLEGGGGGVRGGGNAVLGHHPMEHRRPRQNVTLAIGEGRGNGWT
jgi:hypothetical protein